ncbi:MAG: hypothetical protein KatS3mg081_2919 [Gemmatimonadales bacterium]|nr:MAG: hypothetical protein KatS3mg081_2919 [Gemmatimonadales bacterium]
MLNLHLLTSAGISAAHAGTIPHAHPHGTDVLLALILAVAAAVALGTAVLRRPR